MNEIEEYFGSDPHTNFPYGICQYVDDEIGLCGAYATTALAMPDPIRDMPLCKKHGVVMADDGWDADSTYLVTMDMIHEAEGRDDTGQ